MLKPVTTDKNSYHNYTKFIILSANSLSNNLAKKLAFSNIVIITAVSIRIVDIIRKIRKPIIMLNVWLYEINCLQSKSLYMRQSPGQQKMHKRDLR